MSSLLECQGRSSLPQVEKKVELPCTGMCFSSTIQKVHKVVQPPESRPEGLAVSSPTLVEVATELYDVGGHDILFTTRKEMSTDWLTEQSISPEQENSSGKEVGANSRQTSLSAFHAFRTPLHEITQVTNMPTSKGVVTGYSFVSKTQEWMREIYHGQAVPKVCKS